jgi:hypothetical protein
MRLMGDPNREQPGRAYEAMMTMERLDCYSLQEGYDGA